MSKKKRSILIITSILLIIIIAIGVVFAIVSNRDSSYKLKDNVITINAQSEVQPTEVTENYIAFDNEFKCNEGDVVVAGITDAYKNGFVRRIVSVEEKDGKYIYFTENAYLSDVFETAHIKKYITFTNENAIVDEDGIISGFSAVIRPITSSIGISPNDDGSTSIFLDFENELNDYISFNGEAKLTPILLIEINIEDGQTQFSMTLKNSTEGSLNVSLGTGADFDDSIDIFEKDLPSIEFFVGPVPIVVTNSLSSSIDISGSISGKISTGMNVNNESYRGFEYNSATKNITEIKDTQYDSNDDNIKWEDSKADASAEFEAGIGLSLTSKLYDIMGGELTAGVVGNEGYDICFTPDETHNNLHYVGSVDLSVYPKIEGNVIVDVPLIDESLVDQTLFEFEFAPLWQKSWTSSDNWEQDIANNINSKLVNTYTTRRTEEYKWEQPEFSLKYPNNWNLVNSKLTDTYELGVIENERGVSITFCECNRGFTDTNYGGGYILQEAKIIAIKDSAFRPSWISGGDYSTLGEFAIAKVETYGYYEMHSDNPKLIKYDTNDNNIFYTLIPKTYTKDNGGIIQYKAHGYWDTLSWNYPTPVAIIAEAPNGTFSKQEEREIIEILSTFKENREDFAY